MLAANDNSAGLYDARKSSVALRLDLSHIFLNSLEGRPTLFELVEGVACSLNPISCDSKDGWIYEVIN